MSKDYVLNRLAGAGLRTDKIRKSSKDNGLFVYFNTELNDFKRVYFVGDNESEQDLQATIELMQGESV